MKTQKAPSNQSNSCGKSNAESQGLLPNSTAEATVETKSTVPKQTGTPVQYTQAHQCRKEPRH